jgi:hypothetical protein
MPEESAEDTPESVAEEVREHQGKLWKRFSSKEITMEECMDEIRALLAKSSSSGEVSRAGAVPRRRVGDERSREQNQGNKFLACLLCLPGEGIKSRE